MKLGIMQPYFLPYIGYWQLLNAVDAYVILDDVNYIGRGWINRNRILIHGEPAYLNLPVSKASQNRKINELQVNWDEKERLRAKRKVELAYKRAPYFDSVYPLFCGIVDDEQRNLSEYLTDSIRKICEYLEIETPILLSSKLEKDHSRKGQERILDICDHLGASEYYNAIGGQALYSGSRFQEHKIQLGFVETGVIEYEQFGSVFVPGLSILDVMMFNPVKRIQEFLGEYVIVPGREETEEENESNIERSAE